jgi:hypothetical protein
LRRGKEEVAVALGVDGDESEFEETVASMGEVEVQEAPLEGKEELQS